MKWKFMKKARKVELFLFQKKKPLTFKLCIKIKIYDYLENPNYNFKMKIIPYSLPASIDAITKINQYV